MTESALAGMATPPDVIVAANDDMALGALEALKARNLTGKVALIGFDALPEALAAGPRRRPDCDDRADAGRPEPRRLRRAGRFPARRQEAGGAGDAADADRHHQGQPRQGRAPRRGEVVDGCAPAAARVPRLYCQARARAASFSLLACARARLCERPPRDVTDATMTEPLLRMAGISKRFPGVLALDNVDFEVAPGEIHALLGENGAGKSTLLKILSGAQQPDGGTISFDGQTVTMATPHDAQRLGIVTIYQEFTLAPNMTIAENVFIGREPGHAAFRQLAQDDRRDPCHSPQRLGLDLKPMTLVRDLSVAEQQMVEIARALSMKSRLIVMDEPTSALSSTEVDKLFRIIRDLKAQGLSIIFVTHRLEEVMEICDRYTVLRDGQLVGSGAIAETDDRRHHPPDGRPRGQAPLFAHREPAMLGDGGAAGRRPHPPRQRAGPARHGARQRRRFRSAAARSSASPGSSAPAGPRWRAPIFGADPFDSGRVVIDGRPVASSVRRRTPSATASAWCRKIASSRRCSCRLPSAPISSMAALEPDQHAGHLRRRGAERALVEEYPPAR